MCVIRKSRSSQKYIHHGKLMKRSHKIPELSFFHIVGACFLLMLPYGCSVTGFNKLQCTTTQPPRASGEWGCRKVLAVLGDPASSSAHPHPHPPPHPPPPPCRLFVATWLEKQRKETLVSIANCCAAAAAAATCVAAAAPACILLIV